MPRKGIPTNWKAAEHATALSGVVKTMQSKLLNGDSVAAHHEDFLSQVVELVIALKWDSDLETDLHHALGQPIEPKTVKATIVEGQVAKPQPAGFFTRK